MNHYFFMIGVKYIRFLVLTVLLSLGAIPALAQQQIITQFGNGYAVGAPGQPPVLIQPFGNGYTVAQPGQQPTLVQPFGNGWVVTPPMNGPIEPIPPHSADPSHRRVLNQGPLTRGLFHGVNHG
jgi:hypothetical protein